MGISGLLPLLKSIQRPTELKKFSGETLAVDAYGWLHRGAVSCAVELAEGKPTRKYVDFAMHRVRMAKHFGVTPYLVFDGDFLPSKALTEASRARRRDESRKSGLELLRAGKPSQAYQELQKAIDVTPEMARDLIDELKKMKVPYVVAPYEADAQMVYLERQGLVSGIISEDSDLLVFGAKRLLTKLDPHGQCIEINRRDFCACREISLTGWTDTEFRQMSILSGCDYLDGIGNMGLKTAYRMLRKYKTAEKVIRMLQFDGKFKISENYLAGFRQAELTFLHQRVFCPAKQELVLLTPAEAGSDVEDMPFIGARVDSILARAIAVGDMNPISKELIVPRQQQAGRGLAHEARPSEPRPSGKPIDSYFKGARRIPMGEMDANCFVVNRRSGAGGQDSLVPRVFPLPRPYLDGTNTRIPASSAPISRSQRRRTEPVSDISRQGDSELGPARRRTLEHKPKGIKAADRVILTASPRPPKRARLCDEVDPGDQGEFGRSKFFPLNKGSPQTADGTDRILMSDDSIEEALLELPDVDDWKSLNPIMPTKSIAVFEENSNPVQPRTSTTSDETEGLVPSPGNAPSSPAKSSTRRDSEDHVATEPSASRSRLSMSRFSYTPNARGSSARIFSGVTSTTSTRSSSSTASSSWTASSSSTTSSYSTASSSTTLSSSSTPLRLAMPSPLQRIGVRALQRGKANAAAAKSPQASKPTMSRGASRFEKTTITLFPVNPAFVPLPRVDLDEVEALHQTLGSEDHIIPSSDGEDDQNHTTTAEPRSGRLNLSRFLCK